MFASTYSHFNAFSLDHAQEPPLWTSDNLEPTQAAGIAQSLEPAGAWNQEPDFKHAKSVSHAGL